MVFRSTLILLLSCSACVAAETPATPPEDAVAQARSLVAALGAESYMERAQAKESLIKLGRPAIEPLEAATQDEDPELRLRALEILIAMRGRGFMGIGLNEDPQFDGEGEPLADDDTPRRSAVTANKVLDYKADRYEEIYGVTRQFAAAAAGMLTGDRVTFVNDQPVRGIKDLMREVVRCGPGRVASVTIERDGKEIRLPMRLTRNPMSARINQFDGSLKDPPPPVDMEKEGFANEPQTAAAPVEKKRAALNMEDPIDEVDPFQE